LIRIGRRDGRRMNEFDLFFAFRYALGLVCGVYATVRLVTSVWRWHLYLSPARRSTNLMRQYVILHLLRLRVHRFTLELAQIVGLAALFCVLVYLHRTLAAS